MSNNKEKLNLQLFNVIANDKDSDEARLKKLKYLVRLGADVNASDEFGRTALMIAATWGHLDVVKCLAQGGADVNASTRFGITALMEAAYNGRLGVVKYLAECGADLEASDKYGQTVLDIAKNWKRDDCVKFLEEAQKKNLARKNQGDKMSGSQIVKANEGR